MFRTLKLLFYDETFKNTDFVLQTKSILKCFKEKILALITTELKCIGLYDVFQILYDQGRDQQFNREGGLSL